MSKKSGLPDKYLKINYKLTILSRLAPHPARKDASIFYECLKIWKDDITWQQLHTATKERLKLRDSQGQSWYSNAESGVKLRLHVSYKEMIRIHKL